jgi:hypothetical protein
MTANFVWDIQQANILKNTIEEHERISELTNPLIDTEGNILSGRSEFTAIGLDTFEAEPRVLIIGGCIKNKSENMVFINRIVSNCQIKTKWNNKTNTEPNRCNT